jgi:hypothetical protein
MISSMTSLPPLDLLVYLTALLLFVSKVPDYRSTYQMLKGAGDFGVEQNPLGRLLFRRLGLGGGLVAVVVIHSSLILASVLFYLGLDGFLRTLTGILFCLGGSLVSGVQLQAATFNRTGVMHEPLRSLHRLMSWWYRRRQD